MNLASVHRWHWIVLSLIVGLLLGYSRRQGDQDLQGRFGESITGQRTFEGMLVATEQGRHTFDNIKVHKQQVRDGAGGVRVAYVVTGSAFMGHYDIEEGKQIARWRPMFFVAPIPFKPRTNLNQFRSKGSADFAREFRAIKEPTVIDFLNILGQARGIRYRHAWWNELGIGWWVLASFIVLGMILPTILNLMLFGSWRRPPQRKAVGLLGVRAHADAREEPADQLRLAETQEPNEKPIAATATAELAGADVPVPVRQLDHEPIETTAAEEERQAEFGAKNDDYYPTEVHVPHSDKS